MSRVSACGICCLMGGVIAEAALSGHYGVLTVTAIGAALFVAGLLGEPRR